MTKQEYFQKHMPSVPSEYWTDKAFDAIGFAIRAMKETAGYYNLFKENVDDYYSVK